MRKASTLVGLTLFALAGTARAQQPAPAAAPPAPPPPAAPAPPAPEAATATAAPAQPASEKRLLVGISGLPMAMGGFTSGLAGQTAVRDTAAFGIGFGVSVGYILTHGLVLGIAPQMIFNVKPLEETRFTITEYDLLARVAYLFPIGEGLTFYGELLPGYSLMKPDNGATSKGFVFAFGLGAMVDVTDWIFASLGAGWQYGYQSRKDEQQTLEVRTDYLRVNAGIGFRF